MLGQLPSDRVLRTRVIKHPQPKEYLSELRRFLHLLGQRPRSGIGAPRLGRGVALDGHQCWPEGGPQRQLLGGPRGGVWERGELGVSPRASCSCLARPHKVVGLA